MSNDDNLVVDGRDISMFAIPGYRVVALTQIEDGSYSASAAWDVGADNVQSALEWCVSKREELALEPYRLELYALIPTALFTSDASGIGEADRVAILLQAWNWRVVVTEGLDGQVERIEATSDG